jgi:hypothetical protein
MLSISIDGSDDDLASLISESFGPEAVSAAIAEVAREALAEAEAINTAALGRVVPYTTLVDGRESSDFDRVRPDGSIVGIFDLTTDIQGLGKGVQHAVRIFGSAWARGEDPTSARRSAAQRHT